MLFKRISYKIVLNGLYYLNNEYLYKFLRLFMPKVATVFLHITNECNYNCTYCYVEKSKPSLKFEIWLRLIEEAKNIGVKKICIFGGEPFKSTYLEGLLKKIKRLNLQSYIHTNGSLIDEKWVDKMVNYRPVIIFKYDLNNELYQLHTQQKRYTLEDIEKKISLCRKKGLRVMTFTILFRDNMGGVEQILENSLKYGALPLFERYMPVGNSKLNQSLEISDESFSESMKKINGRINSLNKEAIAALRILGGGCDCFRDVLSISTTGEVLPCPSLPANMSLGNVTDKPLKEIKQAWLLRKNSRNELSQECVKCEHKYICRGGCRAYPLLKYGQYLPNCSHEAFLAHYCAYMHINLYGNSNYFTQPRIKSSDKKDI